MVQDTRDYNALGIGPVEYDMPSVLHAAQAATNIIADSTSLRVIGKHLATRSEIGNVADRLICAPGSEGVSADAEQVGCSATRKTKPGHGLAPVLRKLQRFEYAFKNAVLGDPAGIAFVDSCSQHGELCLVFLFLALQGPQGCAHNFAGVFVTSGFDLLQHEAVKFLSQIDVASGHRPESNISQLAMIANKREMVEAAGVEPASEKVYRERLRAFPIRWF